MLSPNATAITAPLPPIEPKRVLEPTSAEENPVRILVVEDNPVNLQVVLTVCQALGYAPDVAETGQAGIEMAEVNGYDLILLDVQLPDIDGWSVAVHLRQHVRDKELTIVAITANVTPDNRQRCFDSGMDDFVMKPFKISTLKDVILKYARKQTDAAPEPASEAGIPVEETEMANEEAPQQEELVPEPAPEEIAESPAEHLPPEEAPPENRP